MPVCVTGATGFLATHVVRAFLEAGDTVHGTVRSLGNEPVLAPLREAAAAHASRLELFEADLVKPEGSGFADALRGCDVLVHTATPVVVDTSEMADADAERAFTEPAVAGTEALLAAAKAAQVRHVVLTASTGCMLGRSAFDEPRAPSELSADVVSDLPWMRENKQWYRLAKTLQEAAAREFCAANGMSISTLHPSLILGPYFGDASTRLSIGHEMAEAWLRDAGTVVPNGHTGVVDVRQVAAAHVAAAARLREGHAGGRYLLNQNPLWHQEDFAKALHDSAGRPMELALEPESERGYRAVPPTADVRPAADDLGIVLHAPEDVVAATVASLRAHARL